MAGNVWVTNSLGSYLSNDYLSTKWRMQAQPLAKFRQFTTVKEAFGKGKGENLNFDKISNLATEGGVLTETNTMPVTQLLIYKGTLTMEELGKLIARLFSSFMDKFCSIVFGFNMTVIA